MRGIRAVISSNLNPHIFKMQRVLEIQSYVKRPPCLPLGKADSWTPFVGERWS